MAFPSTKFDSNSCEYKEILSEIPKINYTGGWVDYAAAAANGAINIVNGIPQTVNQVASECAYINRLLKKSPFYSNLSLLCAKPNSEYNRSFIHISNPL